jgi:hypothetical protein
MHRLAVDQMAQWKNSRGTRLDQLFDAKKLTRLFAKIEAINDSAVA